jgi:hypothetical protein
MRRGLAWGFAALALTPACKGGGTAADGGAIEGSSAAAAAAASASGEAEPPYNQALTAALPKAEDIEALRKIVAEAKASAAVVADLSAPAADLAKCVATIEKMNAAARGGREAEVPALGVEAARLSAGVVLATQAAAEKRRRDLLASINKGIGDPNVGQRKVSETKILAAVRDAAMTAHRMVAEVLSVELRRGPKDVRLAVAASLGPAYADLCKVPRGPIEALVSASAEREQDPQVREALGKLLTKK